MEVSTPDARSGWRALDVAFYMPGIGSILDGGRSGHAGGAEHQVWSLARSLAGRGHRVATIVYAAPGEVPAESEQVRIIARPQFRPGGTMREVKLMVQSILRAPAPAMVTRCAGPHVGVIALCARVLGRRMVHSSAGVGDFEVPGFLPERRHQLLYRLGMRLADVVVVQTEEQVELCRRAFGREPVLIKSIAAVGEPRAAAPEAFVWVGRWAAYKRPMAYVELARAVPEARFWMIGVPGLDRAGRELEAEVAEAVERTPNLELLAPRSHAGVGELMARAVASVNTTDYEGMPNVLLEAWARGVPALVLNHDPSGVVRRHGLGGFAGGSAERFAQLARELWAARGDVDGELSLRCRRYIEEHHSPERVISQWEQVLSLTPQPTSRKTEAQSYCSRTMPILREAGDR